MPTAPQASSIEHDIDRYIDLRAYQSEYGKLGKRIKEHLLANGQTPITTKAGNCARLKPGTAPTTAWRWASAKLKDYLSRALFAKFCPPSPDDAALNELALSDPNLGKCKESYQTAGTAPSLDVIAATP